MVLFWKIILQILAVAIAILVNVLDYVSTDKRTKKFRIRRRMLFLLSVVFLIGSVILVIGDEWSKRQELAEMTKHLDELKQQGEVASRLATGGDSFGYLSVFGSNASPGLMLAHKGDYPLYDVQIRIVDLDVLDKIAQSSKQITFENLAPSETVHNVGNLNPNQSILIGRINLPTDKDEKGFNVFIMARNGQISQPLRFRRVNGVWYGAYKVERIDVNPPRLLMERSDPEFPKNARGEIAW
ncbi:MAG: hypothetical protein QOJ02_243 [Acidobacteriota bacterium]|jgi:hypothetical protein|nr:hypothetical protein [Acidobacteriota bacterium]